MMHSDHQMTIARQIHQDRSEQAARYRLVRSARTSRERRPSDRSWLRPPRSVDLRSTPGRLEPC